MTRFFKYVTFFILLFLHFKCQKNSHPPKPEEINEKEVLPPVPKITDKQLLDLVQRKTFRYFWDFAHPRCGMARERSQSLETVTTGGSGFGIACFPIAVERGWITRVDALTRLGKILSFLEKADTYHGAFSHWYNGSTANTQKFSTKDDGGDIVETAFLLQGLLINRQYFLRDNAKEKDLRDRITKIWESVEWTWYTRGQKKIYWHWSANHHFAMNMSVTGWNECLIVYVLAASSPKYPIDKATYTQGWARNGAMKNQNSYYGYQLPIGQAKGGPLFFAHYSFIGLDPRGLKDDYVNNYFQQNRMHSLINYEHCKRNPNNYKGYSADNWGLTASDNHKGYAAHSPTNDLGVITPTAALSSFPYTPEESKKALEYFYYKQHHKLWGIYGFRDAFSLHHNWFAGGYLAIDQGPIIAMIENYRTQLLWNLFMKDKEIKNGLTKLGFTTN